jgi:hypothetical protein
MAGSKIAAKRIFPEISAVHVHSAFSYFPVYIFSGVADTPRFSRRLALFLPGKSTAMSYNLLKGKKGIIFGALDEKSIAWKTALRCHEEGAELILTNAPVALRMGTINQLAEAVKAPVVGADVTSMDDLKKLFEEANKELLLRQA